MARAGSSRPPIRSRSSGPLRSVRSRGAERQWETVYVVDFVGDGLGTTRVVSPLRSRGGRQGCLSVRARDRRTHGWAWPVHRGTARDRPLAGRLLRRPRRRPAARRPARPARAALRPCGHLGRPHRPRGEPEAGAAADALGGSDAALAAPEDRPSGKGATTVPVLGRRSDNRPAGLGSLHRHRIPPDEAELSQPRGDHGPPPCRRVPARLSSGTREAEICADALGGAVARLGPPKVSTSAIPIATSCPRCVPGSIHHAAQASASRSEAKTGYSTMS